MAAGSVPYVGHGVIMMSERVVYIVRITDIQTDRPDQSDGDLLRLQWR